MDLTGAQDSRHRRIRSIVAVAALASLALFCVAASAQASGSASGSGGISGGVSGGGGGVTPSPEPPLAPGCMDTQLGKRDLRVGDCGVDVETLNWILKAKDFGAVPLTDEFDDPTAEAVSEFQGTADLQASGVFNATTATALFRAMPAQVATWYGPGLYGRQTACGETLTPRTVGVAHKTLPCGSRVVVRYRGRFVRTTVIDRGPYANGASWDLTQATARVLHFTSVGVDKVRVAKIRATQP